MERTKHIFLVILISIIATSACNVQTTQTEPTAAPMQILEPVFPQSKEDLPLTEAEVPRVSVEEAKTALDSAAAVIVDVRSANAYAASHIPGAISVQLGEIETNPSGLNLDKDQWIITYCT